MRVRRLETSSAAKGQRTFETQIGHFTGIGRLFHLFFGSRTGVGRFNEM